ncbi:MAG: hypothetical protein V5A57_02735 [Candidatus Paceibacterota bacterium]
MSIDETKNLELSDLSGARDWEKVNEEKAKGFYKGGKLGRFPGVIKLEYDRLEFYIKDLPKEIQNTSHAGCFQHKGDNLWHVHFVWEPDSLLDGILGIENILHAAAETTEDS